MEHIVQLKNSDLKSAISRLCQLQREHFLITLELTTVLAAAREVMKNQGYEDFLSNLQTKTLQLKQGDIGDKNAQDIQRFDQGIRELLASLQ
jgi:hypothetical protein